MNRLECENCGTTFPARPEYEVTLPPHDCAQRARARREQNES